LEAPRLYEFATNPEITFRVRESRRFEGEDGGVEKRGQRDRQTTNTMGCPLEDGDQGTDEALFMSSVRGLQSLRDRPQMMMAAFAEQATARADCLSIGSCDILNTIEARPEAHHAGLWQSAVRALATHSRCVVPRLYPVASRFRPAFLPG
jgi:hypothetical protein